MCIYIHIFTYTFMSIIHTYINIYQVIATEDREIFNEKLREIGEKIAQSATAVTIEVCICHICVFVCVCVNMSVYLCAYVYVYIYLYIHMYI
jgi:hypothetical protein